MKINSKDHFDIKPMKVKKTIEESIEVKQNLLQEKYIKEIEKAGKTLVAALKNNRTVLIAGNGGSAADAQHFAGELVNRFLTDRQALPAIALTCDSSILTSISNDSDFKYIFSRQIEALGGKGDIFIGISTSGNAENIAEAMKKAKEKGMLTIGLLGSDGGKINKFCDLSIVVPSRSTPRIQEAHILVIHILCGLIDNYFGRKNVQ